VSRLLALGGLLAGLLAVPAVAVCTLLVVTGAAVACTPTMAGGLAASAPVPAAARVWVALTHAVCPALPQPWIAAVMDQESGFDPTAYAPDANGGTWGLYQLDSAMWTATYGAPPDADLNHDGVWDIVDPDIHAVVGGEYFCALLRTVDQTRAAHPGWASTTQLTALDDLVIAHNAGLSRLATYPQIPTVTVAYLRAVDARAAAWSAPAGPGSPTSSASPGSPNVPVAGCTSGLGAGGGVIVPPGTPAGVAAAVRTALGLVGARTGWAGLCDHLVCAAYGFANSGYVSAAAHWAALLATGHAHPGDPCPPVGAFMFWATAGPDGHVALVVQSDPACSPQRIELVSNDVGDAATGGHGGVYLVTLARIEDGFVTRAGYLGWSDPICAGVPLPAVSASPTP